MCVYLVCRGINIVTHTFVGQYIPHVNHRLCDLISRQIAKLGIICNGKFRGKEYLIVIDANVIDTRKSFVNRTDKSGSAPRARTALGLGLSIGIVKEISCSVTLYKLNEALNDIPSVFLISVIECCFCKLAGGERRDRLRVRIFITILFQLRIQALYGNIPT